MQYDRKTKAEGAHHSFAGWQRCEHANVRITCQGKGMIDKAVRTHPNTKEGKTAR